MTSGSKLGVVGGVVVVFCGVVVVVVVGEGFQSKFRSMGAFSSCTYIVLLVATVIEWDTPLVVKVDSTLGN
jgi:hypothetical protein